MNLLFSNIITTENSSLNYTSQGNPYSFIIILIIFGLIFYFMIFRPQQKRNKDHKKLIQSISKGDEILTAGGLIGRVTKIIENNYIILSLNENNEVIIKRDFIVTVLPKGTMKTL
ncbi:preprotein translocase subunit YajC [Candidatus Schneideria nysicola]|uniref:preprotein translocase subunit YajC n=1 Tax=Candidatus Schneideria nysicola TaxID=1081631 RepID=UPI001CAA777C|nr:preprotein translocase subunit YajC [Candidatus Schneideria nysicola]UAJ65436.1 preprotein translocase subunit YajC [Candidatus Schneideria nysicola]